LRFALALVALDDLLHGGGEVRVRVGPLVEADFEVGPLLAVGAAEAGELLVVLVSPARCCASRTASSFCTDWSSW